MFDFITEGHVPLWIWMCYFLTVIIVFVIGTSYIKKPSKFYYGNNKKALAFVIFFTIFALFYCLNSDFFRYREFAHHDYRELFFIADLKDIEAYYYIALLCNGNFELFRIIIWGGAFLIFYFTCKNFRAPTYLSILLFFLMFNDIACYGRVTLAMAVYFLGLSIILGKKKYLLGALITLSSVFFHHSLVVAIAVLPIVFMPKNKIFQFILYLAVIVIIFYLIPSVMGEADSLQDDETLGYFGRKMSSSQNKIENGVYSQNGSTLGLINDLLSYLVFYVPIIGIYFRIKKVNLKLSDYHSIDKLYKVTTGMVLLATGFLVSFQSFNVLFYRVLYMCMIPTSIVLAFLLAQDIVKKDFMYLILSIALLHQLGLYLSNILAYM